MELALKQITLLVLFIGVLITVSMFVMTQSSIELSKTEANRIFNTKCLEYKEKYSCNLGAADTDPDFGKFVDSCRVLYGSERESLTCLTKFCSYCDENRLRVADLADDTKCAAICEYTTGSRAIGLSTGLFCGKFRQKCGASGMTCDACPNIV